MLHTCLKCDKSWSSNKPGHPVQCKYCKRKDWDGLHNSYGRLLPGAVVPGVPVAAAGVAVAAGVTACKSCGSTWSSGRAGIVTCPFCHVPIDEVLPVVAGVPCTCVWCGGSWVSRSAETVPIQCPKCKRVKWAGVDPFDPEGLLEPGRCKCDKCGNDWVSRSAELPKICPSCKSPEWCPAVVAKFWHERGNPVEADCAIKWFYRPNGGPLMGDPVTGVHKWQVNKTGICYVCGWNNHTGVQVGCNNPAPITEAERERRKIQWEMENPGEKW